MTAAIDTGLKPKERADVARELSKVLADSFAVYQKTHGYHWNVRGPEFFSLHKLLEEQYREIWAALDDIAERIRALGYPAPGTYAEFLELTRLEEPKPGLKAEDMIRYLIKGQETVVRTARETLPVAEKANDQPTLDLLTQRMQIHEKNAWMLRSLLED